MATMKEENKLRRVIVGFAIFLVGVGFGYWWHLMAVG